MFLQGGEAKVFLIAQKQLKLTKVPTKSVPKA